MVHTYLIVNYQLKIGYQNLPQLVEVLERQEMSRKLLSRGRQQVVTRIPSGGRPGKQSAITARRICAVRR